MRPTKEAGVFTYTAADYHADKVHETPTLSNSVARTLAKRSPLHAWTEHPRLNPKYEAKEREDFDYGSACHALLLEGENRMVVLPYADYRKADAQSARDIARADGRYPILEHKYGRVLLMREAALRAIDECPHFKGLHIADGKTEQTLIWQEGKAWCRTRPDCYWPQIATALDYKTTGDATPNAFSRQIGRMGYDFQDSFYRRGINAVFGLEESTFLFMAQETEPPFACSFHACAPSLREMADVDVGRAIRGWEWCMEHNLWPSYDPRVHWAEAPSWQLAEHMDRMEEQNGIPYDPAVLWGPK